MADNVTTTTSSPAGFADATTFATKDSTNDGHLPLTQLATTDGTDVTPYDIEADLAALVTDAAAAEALLTTIDADTSSLAGTVSGSEVQVDVISRPANDRTTDNVGAALVTDAIMQDATVRTPAFAVINAASGDNSIVAAQGSGNKIRVLSYVLVAGGTTTARFESGAGGTALTGVMPLVANSGVSAPFSPVGHFETGANAALSLEATGDIDGHVTYIVVT